MISNIRSPSNYWVKPSFFIVTSWGIYRQELAANSQRLEAWFVKENTDVTPSKPKCSYERSLHRKSCNKHVVYLSWQVRQHIRNILVKYFFSSIKCLQQCLILLPNDDKDGFLNLHMVLNRAFSVFIDVYKVLKCSLKTGMRSSVFALSSMKIRIFLVQKLVAFKCLWRKADGTIAIGFRCEYYTKLSKCLVHKECCHLLCMPFAKLTFL